MFTTYNDVYLDTRRTLLKQKISMPELEAIEIVRFATGKTREELVRDKYLHIAREDAAKIERLTSRRLCGEPLAYILGEWDFYGMTLKVTPDVLIPRSDTEALVDCALRRASGDFRFLDLGCGSGCISVALGSMRNASRGVCVDISDKALAVAKENIYNARLTSRISCIKGDMLKAPPANIGEFDVLVSNPPYITNEEMKELDDSVLRFEPYGALCGGEDGLDFYRAICENWACVIKNGGIIAFECGIAQATSLEKLLLEHGFWNIQITRDNSGICRVVSGIK